MICMTFARCASFICCFPLMLRISPSLRSIKKGRALGTRAAGQEQTRPILWPSVFCACNIVYNIIIYQKMNVIFVQDAPCAFVQDAPYHTIFHISFPNRHESPVFAPGARRKRASQLRRSGNASINQARRNVVPPGLSYRTFRVSSGARRGVRMPHPARCRSPPPAAAPRSFCRAASPAPAPPP